MLGERLDHRRTHHVEPVGEVDGADQRLGHVGHDVLVGDELVELALLVTGAEAPHEVGSPSLVGDHGAGGAADDVGAQTRQTAFGVVGEATIELGRHGEAEHAVAEELEALVGAAALGHP